MISSNQTLTRSASTKMAVGTHDNCMSVYFRHGTIANVIIQRIISCTIVDLATANYTINAGTTYACRFECRGNDFKIYINDVLKVSVTDDNALKTNTKVGMLLPLTTSAAYDYFDNFTVKG